jgi:crotonobetainyl-CoA:carnitine CoA-transferase CaiB-like acyl-CoA transferase
MTGVTPKLSGTPGRVRWTGRRLGADTDDVMGTILGLAPEEIEKKRRGGAL